MHIHQPHHLTKNNTEDVSTAYQIDIPERPLLPEFINPRSLTTVVSEPYVGHNSGTSQLPSDLITLDHHYDIALFQPIWDHLSEGSQWQILKLVNCKLHTHTTLGRTFIFITLGGHPVVEQSLPQFLLFEFNDGRLVHTLTDIFSQHLMQKEMHEALHAHLSETSTSFVSETKLCIISSGWYWLMDLVPCRSTD